MLEIIAMISLGKTIRNIVREKGLKPTSFIINMILMWIGFEIMGIYIGFSLFHNPFGAYLCAMAGAALGGYFSYKMAVNAEPQITD